MAETAGTQGEPLRKQLEMWHMTMVSLGGVIGAGLFVGSGAVINAVGRALRGVVAEIGIGGAGAVREVGK